jgi:hypothetical protein
MFLIAGLLIVSLSQLLAQFVALPDFARGALIGVGTGLEIVAVIKLAAYRQNEGGLTQNQ